MKLSMGLGDGLTVTIKPSHNKSTLLKGPHLVFRIVIANIVTGKL